MVLVLPEDAPSQTEIGIYLPDKAMQTMLWKGVVRAVGPGVFQNGALVAPVVKSGDTVLYSKHGGTEFKINNVTHRLMSENEIWAILD